MKALVTGGAGLIGSHLTDLLLESGHSVRVLDSLDSQTHPQGPPKWLQPDAEFVYANVCDPEAWASALKGVDAVFHQAATGGLTAEFSRYFDVNVTGTVRMFESIQKNNLDVRKIVVASSQAVYGEGLYHCSDHGALQPPMRSINQLEDGLWEPICPSCRLHLVPRPTPERADASTTTAYGTSKYLEERAALALGRGAGLPVVALRYAVTYGPRQSVFNPYTGVIAIFSTRLLNDLPPVVYEDGLQTRDFVYVRDVARANLFVATQDRLRDRVFNVGTGVATAMGDLARRLAVLFGKRIEPSIPGEFRPADVRHLFLDATALTDEGWKPEYSLDRGIEAAADWILSQGSLVEYFTSAASGLKDLGIVRSKR